MKDVNLLIWLVQLGISVAVPLVGFILLGVWLHNSREWGSWVVIAGVIFGISGSVSGLRSSLQYLNKASKSNDEDNSSVISYNEHD
ncbi:MAG: AtpZ/AtpI family protein [Oscillospiraceae bacterium]|nr:AtpZ/AtpI family protein [Oscillospiraceae bacterium]